MPALFDPLPVKSLTLRNRIGVSPMCQYSSVDGLAQEWHRIHLGSRAVGGAALVVAEATAVSPEGRITPGDAGIWSDEHGRALEPITAFIKGQGAVPGIQLAHAGRKASADLPWRGGAHLTDSRGWETLAPSPIAFGETLTKVPRAMDAGDIAKVKADFASAAQRALRAGFQWLEIHAAHGYLLHEFLSPLSNRRSDRYGGAFENRIRLVLETVAGVREVWPDRYPISVRLSCTDWAPGGWALEDSVALSRALKAGGVDFIDCSSGALIPGVSIPSEPGYQVPFAERIRREAGIATIAVGLITEPEQADAIVASGKADLVFLARALLRDPYWPLHAAKRLGVADRVRPPIQYGRAF